MSKIIYSGSSVSRRKFLSSTSIGVLAVSLGMPFLSGCKSNDVSNFFQNLIELSNLINAYRKQNNLKEIPVSDKLTMVALRHVMDLNTYHPEKSCGVNGNLHSWSNNGNWSNKPGVGAWKGCCYPDDHSNSACMWDKGKEIANYPDNAVEIVHWEGSGSISAQSALNSLQESNDHNDVILNKKGWSSSEWKAIGAIAFGHYACAWFGVAKD